MLEKRLASQSGLWRKSDAANFECWTWANNSRFSRLRRRSQKAGRKSFLYGIDQIHSPLPENRCNLVMKLFGDKVIEPGVGFQQRGVESSLRTVSRMEVECRIH